MHNWIGLAKPKYSVFSFRLKMLQHVSFQPTQHAVTATALALHCHRDIYHIKSALGCFVLFVVPECMWALNFPTQ